jgi:hypothetical protein
MGTPSGRSIRRFCAEPYAILARVTSEAEEPTSRPTDRTEDTDRPADVVAARRTETGTPVGRNGIPDQTHLTLFRALLILQVVVGALLGLITLVVPDTFATLTGAAGPEPLIYRVAGAATLGYAVMALLGVFRPTWAALRIPLLATFTFNLAAAAGSLISLGEGDLRAIVYVIALAASAFTLVAGYWLYRNEGPDVPVEEPVVESGFRVTLILATAAGLFFGIVPLLMANAFATALELPRGDLFILRMAGAATLGYGVTGIFELLSGRWRAIRIETIAAIVFNALAAVSAAIYLATGGHSLIGWIVLIAGGFFAFAMTGWAARAER